MQPLTNKSQTDREALTLMRDIALREHGANARSTRWIQEALDAETGTERPSWTKRKDALPGAQAAHH